MPASRLALLCRLNLAGVHHLFVFSFQGLFGGVEPDDSSPAPLAHHQSDLTGFTSVSFTCTQYGTESRRMQAIETICNNVAWIALPRYLLVK